MVGFLLALAFDRPLDLPGDTRLRQEVDQRVEVLLLVIVSIITLMLTLLTVIRLL